MTSADDPFLRRPEEGTMRPAEPSGFPGSPWDDAAATPSPAPAYTPVEQAPPPYGATPYATAPAPAQTPYPAYASYGTGWRRPDEKNWMGIIALVAGIMGFFMPLVGSVTAIVFGHLGRGAAKRGEASNGGMALAGLILGYLVTGVFVLVIVLSIVLALVASTGTSYSGI